MQAAGSVDHPLPQQSDAGGWGRATCGWGRVTGGEGQSLPQSDVGGWDRVTGGEGEGHGWVGQNTNGWSDVAVDGWGHWRAG